MLDYAHSVALAIDLYQLTMGASYSAVGVDERATFSLFVRRLPANRSFLVVAGLEEALDRLRAIRFDEAALAYLRSTGQIREDFLDWLRSFQFTGDVWAVPEGRVVFPNEPMLEVQAPVIEAQIVETTLINAIHFPTLVATKAARCVTVAPGKALVDFGLRRTPSVDAGLAAARAMYLTGFAATSNLLAGERFGIPIAGTVAHSYVQTFDDELAAFRSFAETFPGPVTLLIDTYDTLQGARHAVEVARELEARGGRLAAVRLDSGDLVELSRKVRLILDDAGLDHVRIIASGGLDEYELQHLAQADAPIDSFGVGTNVVTSVDAPAVDLVYKLVEFAGKPRLKLSPGKQTLVGAKQVWRHRGADGEFCCDVVAGQHEAAPSGSWEPLLTPVMRGGQLLVRPTLDEIRARHREEMASLPEHLLVLDGQAPYPVELSERLEQRQRATVESALQQEDIDVTG